jgi:hypothetical protein
MYSVTIDEAELGSIDRMQALAEELVELKPDCLWRSRRSEETLVRKSFIENGSRPFLLNAVER